MRTLCYLVVFLVAFGCQKKSEPIPHADDDHEHDEHEEPGHAPEANVLRVNQSMLRDLRITTNAAELRTAADSANALGELRLDENTSAEVGSSIVARVRQVHASAGDLVRAGDPLIELDSVNVGEARAAANATAARVELARRNAERRRALAGEQIVSQREIDSAEAELLQATAEHNAALQSVRALGASRGAGAGFTLRSPIDGTVIERNAVRGRLVDVEHSLFVIGDLRRLWFVAQAFERDALRVQVGRTARVTFAALPGETYTGQVSLVGSRVNPTSRTVEVRLDIENPRGILRPGMSARAQIPLGDIESRIVAVPLVSVQRLEDGWCVFIPRGEPGVFEVRPVGRGRDLSGEVEILQGVREGELIVVDGAFLLRAELEKSRGGGSEHDHH